MSESQAENIVMNRTVNWQTEISAIAGPYRSGDTRESWLARAARKSTATFWHIKALYYSELKDPKYSIAYKVLSAAQRARIEEARRDASKLSDIYHGAAMALINIDPDFHRGNIDALVSAARILGSLDGAGTEGDVK